MESVVPVLVRVTKDRTNYLLSFVPQRDSGDHRWVGIVFMWCSGTVSTVSYPDDSRREKWKDGDHKEERSHGRRYYGGLHRKIYTQPCKVEEGTFTNNWEGTDILFRFWTVTREALKELGSWIIISSDLRCRGRSLDWGRSSLLNGNLPGTRTRSSLGGPVSIFTSTSREGTVRSG